MKIIGIHVVCLIYSPDPDISLPSTGFLHNGPDGVAVYRAPQMAFTYGTVAEPQSVVDGIVYSLTGDAAVSMATKLTPGKAYLPKLSPEAKCDQVIGLNISEKF